MTKIELLQFVRDRDQGATSAEVAEGFGIPRKVASAYLRKNFGRGYLRRWKHYREYLYFLSPSGEKQLEYWEPRQPEMLLRKIFGNRRLPCFRDEAQPLEEPEWVVLACVPCRIFVVATRRAANEGVWHDCEERMVVVERG